jgi:hypothetical protein
MFEPVSFNKMTQENVVKTSSESSIANFCHLNLFLRPYIFLFTGCKNFKFSGLITSAFCPLCLELANLSGRD